jgi:hypothetical protein
MSPIGLHAKPISPTRVPRRLVSIAAGLGALAAVLASMALVAGPDFVASVTLDNRTGTQLDVAVTDASGRRLMVLGAAEPGEALAVREVVDQGEVWVFVVRRAGSEIGRLRVTRSELSTNRWRVVLPVELDRGPRDDIGTGPT